MNTLFWLMIVAYSVGALAALIGGRGLLGRNITGLSAVVGATAGMALAALVIFNGTPYSLIMPHILPVGGGLALRLDPLGAFFLVIIGIGAIPAAIYGIGYTAAYDNSKTALPVMGSMFNLFLLSMSLVTLADNVFTFLIMWEGMSLTSYFLVITETENEEAISAGIWYIAMTHAGLAMLMAAFLLLAGNTAGTFADLRSQATVLSSTVRGVIFVLAFLGFGSKAGIIPLHVWLPRAHPAAPSHVSALMSGVMIKLGIYGLLRITLDLLGGGPAWWGLVVLIAGAVSALLGVLYALMEHDLKRLLAYHSVENIGIILLGIGAGLLFHSYGIMSLAMLGFVGGLFHTLNHATFKGLLFLGAGSVLHAVHTRNMEEMGGLIKRMPQTAFFFLIGAAAISALPPLNGFASEWLVFQALLSGIIIPNPELAMVMPVAVGMLALTSGLAAACFVKAFGITFLAIPRSAEAEHAHESPLSMQLGMGILAVVCVVLGVGATTVAQTISNLLIGLGGLPQTAATFQTGLIIKTPASLGQFSPVLLTVLLLAMPVLTLLGLYITRANRSLRVNESWGCGRTGQTPRMEYTATAFAQPLRRVFAELYRPTRELIIDFHPESKYFVQSIHYKSEIIPWFERFLYEPLLRLIGNTAYQVRRLQSGSLHLYLFYMAFTLIGLLLLVRWF